MKKNKRFQLVRSNIAGSALLELAIAVPLMLTLVIGVTGFGLVLRRNQVISAAAKHGGRSAATQPAGLECCGGPPADCAAPGSIQAVAWCGAKQYLKETGMDESKWEIKPKVEEMTEDSITVLTVKVEIQPSPTIECLLCGYQRFTVLPKEMGATSSFALQSVCNNFDTDDCKDTAAFR